MEYISVPRGIYIYAARFKAELGPAQPMKLPTLRCECRTLPALQVHAGLICLDSALEMYLDLQRELFKHALDTLAELPDLINQALSFALQDVVLLLTEVNERRSTSGSVPMLVPRN